MPSKWRFLEPVTSTSTVSQNYTGRPIVGPVLSTTGLPRILIGWNHQDDTPEGQMKGQLYCCVSVDKGTGYEKLSIFDTSGNRSPIPGEVVVCGVANFTMIRMFHPYWAEAGPNGTIPRDMAWRPHHGDKARLRELYHKFLRDHFEQDEGEATIYMNHVPEPETGTPVIEEAAEDQNLFINQENPLVPRLANDEILFINQGDAGISKSAAPMPQKRRTRQYNVLKVPNVSKAKAQRKLCVSKKQPPNLPSSMTEASLLPFTGQGNDELVEREPTGPSLINETNAPIAQNSPGTSLVNPIDLIDLSEPGCANEETPLTRNPQSETEATTTQVPVTTLGDAFVLALNRSEAPAPIQPPSSTAATTSTTSQPPRTSVNDFVMDRWDWGSLAAWRASAGVEVGMGGREQAQAQAQAEVEALIRIEGQALSQDVSNLLQLSALHSHSQTHDDGNRGAVVEEVVEESPDIEVDVDEQHAQPEAHERDGEDSMFVTVSEGDSQMQMLDFDLEDDDVKMPADRWTENEFVGPLERLGWSNNSIDDPIVLD